MHMAHRGAYSQGAFECTLIQQDDTLSHQPMAMRQQATPTALRADLRRIAPSR